jgi:hypothetical protein
VAIGFILIIIGVLSLIIEGAWPISFLIIACSTPLILSTQGFIFDTTNKRYRSYFSVFKMKVGEAWKPYILYNIVVLAPFNEAQVMNYKSISRNVRARGFEVMLSNNAGLKLVVIEINNYFRARRIFDQLTQSLGFEGIDYYEEVMKDILSRGKRR